MNNIITSLRQESVCHQAVQLVREGEGGPAEARFFARLVEDRANFPGGSMSYAEYLSHVNRQSLAPAPLVPQSTTQ